MQRTTLEPLVAEGLSERQIAERLGTSRRTTSYWLSKHSLKTVNLPHNANEGPRHCSCGETDPSKFYGKKTKACARCHNADVLLRGQDKRKRAIAVMGGKCMDCGYDRYYGALDFHHRDPADKDPSFANLRGWSWERIEKEIAKCDLVCRNCHAERHAGYGV